MRWLVIVSRSDLHMLTDHVLIDIWHTPSMRKRKKPKNRFSTKSGNFCIGHSAGKEKRSDACQQSELYQLAALSRDSPTCDYIALGSTSLYAHPLKAFVSGLFGNEREGFPAQFGSFRFQRHFLHYCTPMNTSTPSHLYERALSGAKVRFKHMPSAPVSILDEAYVTMLRPLSPYPCRAVTSVFISSVGYLSSGTLYSDLFAISSLHG